MPAMTLAEFEALCREEAPFCRLFDFRVEGFDDSAAKWGLNRHIQNGCGKTLDETLNFYERHYDSSNPLPFLLIETWNDYEEGTAIEQRTATNCGGAAATSSAQSTAR